MQSMHDSQFTGHLCERQTLARVKSRFFWPGMSGDVNAWCRTCMQCARRKGLTNNNRAPMHAITEGYFLQQVGVDILAPLERTTSGNQYVLVLTDYFTKWRATFPLIDMEAGIVAKTKNDGGDGEVPLVRHQEDTILCIPLAREWTCEEVNLNASQHAVHHGRWEPAPVRRHAAVCHGDVQQQRL
ncbi:Retrovirus-related Pol polyprotein from transposon [Trichinella sp. T9]|nr:Retrovirus-related Pol polyprotein from transposon [Trichinella sp. T9]KRX51289.1 Retrovirus-related Pol polyprotein from transposon [Trichinella sp. T9]